MSTTRAFDNCRRIEYRTLMIRLAEFVGHHHLPIKADAADINDILDGDPVHNELAREVVRSIYRSTRCSHLDAEVRAETVFNSLGSIRGRLLADGETDIDQMNLLENLGWAARALFALAEPSADDFNDDTEAAQDDRPVVLQYPAV